MAITRSQGMSGDTKWEIIKGITFSGTDEETTAHNLGVVPTSVMLTPTSPDPSHVVSMSSAADASNITLHASNGSATCEVKVMFDRSKPR